MDKGSPFLKCVVSKWLHIAQIALDLPTPSLSNGYHEPSTPPQKKKQKKTGNCPFGCEEKSAPNHPGKRLHPTPLTDNSHLETTHLKKGHP